MKAGPCFFPHQTGALEVRTMSPLLNEKPLKVRTYFFYQTGYFKGQDHAFPIRLGFLETGPCLCHQTRSPRSQNYPSSSHWVLQRVG